MAQQKSSPAKGGCEHGKRNQKLQTSRVSQVVHDAILFNP